MDEISYSPGRLAQKIGVSRQTVIRHLKKSGLISHCFRDANGWWRIPYSIAEKITSTNALAIPPPTYRRTSHYKEPKPETPRTEKLSPKTPVNILLQERDYDNLARYYKEIGTVLQNAGVTMTDMLKGVDLSDVNLDKDGGNQ